MNTKKPSKFKKRRQSIEKIRSEEREIFGELFAVEKESSDSDCIVTGSVNRYGEFMKRMGKSHEVKRTLKFNDILDKHYRSEKHHECSKHSDSSSRNFSEKYVDRKVHCSRSRNMSGKFTDGKKYCSWSRNISTKSLDKKVQSCTSRIFSSQYYAHTKKSTNMSRISSPDDSHNVNSDTKLAQEFSKQDILKHKMQCSEASKKVHNRSRYCSSSSESKEHNNDVNKSRMNDIEETVPHSNQNSSRIANNLNREMDNHKMFLFALDRKFKKCLKKFIVSPRSKKEVQKGGTPFIRLRTSDTLPLASDKPRSQKLLPKLYDESKTLPLISEVSTCVNYEPRHFMDVFSDISEEENELDNLEDTVTDCDSHNQTVTDMATSDTLVNPNVKQIPEPGLHYGVESHERSDICDVYSQIVIEGIEYTVISDADELDAVVTNPDASNQSSNADDLDDTTVYDLENTIASTEKQGSSEMQMPILEKFTDYADFKTDLEDEDLPDIDCEVLENIETTQPMQQTMDSLKPIDKSNQPSRRDTTCDNNIFSKFSLVQDELLEVSATLSSARTSSSVSSVQTSSIKIKSSNIRDTLPSSIGVFEAERTSITISSPKISSTRKAHKRKLVKKSMTYISPSCSRSIPTSSQFEKLPISTQMKQLNRYIENVLTLNDSNCTLPMLPEAQKNIVYCCEEEGQLQLGHALNFVQQFSKKYIIPSNLCGDVIKSAFHSDCNLSHIYWAHKLLSELNMQQLAFIEIQWETIDSCLRVTLVTTKDKTCKELLQSSLLLQLCMEVLKTDLYTKNLSNNREIMKTMAYRMFAYDVSTANRRNLIYYLNQALHAGQCRTRGDEEQVHLPDVLPMLQVITIQANICYI